ncbi:MAG: flagellar hook-length control protein FliK [Lachnospiraceae bacterium]|nr:flagellar hook-length control protein FliK [Lachnospiraceae bacterium]
MNIRVNSNLLNNNQISDASQTQQVPNSRLGTSLAAQITELNVGDVFTGKIMDLNGQTLQLLLSDKSTINAKLANMMRLQAGQTMSFEVTSNAGGKVQLTPLYANLTGENQVAKALGEAGLPYDARSSEMVKSMMEQGMKIDADSLLNMARTVNNYPDAAPSSIVNMKALNIPLDPVNVQQFEIYRNNAHQIAEHVSGIASGFSEVAGESPLLNNMLLNIFVGEADPEIGEMLKEAKALAQEEAPVVENGETAVAETADKAGGEAAVAAENAEAAAQGETALNSGDRIVIPEKAEQADVRVVESPKQSFYGDNTVTDSLKELYTPEEKEQLASELEKLGVPKSLTDKIRNDEYTPRETLQLARNAISQGSESLSGDELQQFTANVRHMLKEPVYSRLVKNEIMDSLLMKPEDVMDKEKVQEYFRRVVHDTAKAAEVLQSSGHGETTLAAANQDLHDNIDFMNQMNQMFTYMQMPLKMASEAQHGDLYIYTNKKKLASGDGNVSALLHLDMTHLGTLDVHVSMNAEKVVNTHFILQNEEMLDFIAEHLPELDERINRRGYHMRSDVSLNSEKKTVPEIMFDKGKNTKLIQYTSFDAKA